MTRLDDALRDGGLTWRSGDDEWTLHGGGDEVGRIRDDVVTLDGTRYELRSGRGYTTLVHAGRGSRVGSLRLLGHGSGAVTLPSSRVRISKRGVNPFRWEVTDDLSGPRLLEVLHLLGRVSLRPGEALADHDVPLDVLAVFTALTIAPELRTRALAASAPEPA